MSEHSHADAIERKITGCRHQIMQETSTKPDLLRAIYEWCTDNGFTPYIAAVVDGQTRVPREFVKNGEIVLNISFNATSGLKMDNDTVHFSARFGGVAREIVVPVENVVAIYARENGQGMAFEPSKSATQGYESASDAVEFRAETAPELASVTPFLSSVPVNPAATESEGTKNPPDDRDPPKKGGKPTLTRIK